MPTRRLTLLLPLLAAACASRREPAAPPPGPISYTHLTRLPLNVATVEIAPEGPQPAGAGLEASPSPAEAVRIMGRDRLEAVGSTGRAVFTVTVASLVRDRARLSCLLGCRLEILSPEGARLGFVEAQASRVVTGPDAERPNAADLLLRRTMDDLNVEFEFQIRRNLKDWLVTAGPVPEGAGEVTQEELPKP
jgi:hypothetical protein